MNRTKNIYLLYKMKILNLIKKGNLLEKLRWQMHTFKHQSK